MNTYDIGDPVTLTGLFTNKAHVTVDPDTVSIRYRKPDRTRVTKQYLMDVEVERVERGHYRIAIEPDADGFWYYRWWSTGSGKCAGEGVFEVRKSMVLED